MSQKENTGRNAFNSKHIILPVSPLEPSVVFSTGYLNPSIVLTWWQVRQDQ